jgi:hypothetical protein
VEPDEPRKRARLAIAAAGLVAVVAVVVAVASLLDLGPFADELSREELIAEGNEICAEAQAAFADLQADPPTTAREAADLTEQLIGISEDELEEIGDLDAPAELDDELDRYLDARERGIELLRDGLEAARDEDATAYAEAQASVAEDQVERLKLAREVGFTECSRPATGSG